MNKKEELQNLIKGTEAKYGLKNRVTVGLASDGYYIDIDNRPYSNCLSYEEAESDLLCIITGMKLACGNDAGKILCFDEKASDRAFEALKYELDYYINESNCAEEYNDVILFMIETLYRLGHTATAARFKNQYKNELSEQIAGMREYCYDPVLKKELKDLKKGLKEFWDSLKESAA